LETTELKHYFTTQSPSRTSQLTERSDPGGEPTSLTLSNTSSGVSSIVSILPLPQQPALTRASMKLLAFSSLLVRVANKSRDYMHRYI